MIREGVNEHRRVLAGFHDLVQITDRPRLHGPAQGAVHPSRFLPLQKITPHQVSRSQVLVARHRDQRDAAESVGHMLNEAGLAAAGWAFQEDRQVIGVGDLKNLHLPAHGEIERLLAEDVLLDGVFVVSRV